MSRLNRSDNNRHEQKTRRNIVFSVSTVVFAALVLIFYVISNLPALASFIGKTLSILSPLIYGAALAYLCNPILKLFEKYPLRRIRSLYLKRMLSIFLTYLTFILVIAAIGFLVVPQLVNSFRDLFGKYENLIANTVTFLNQIISDVMKNLPIEMPGGVDEPFISLDKINALLETLIGNIGDLFDVLLDNIQSYGARLFSSISNAILALFISFYLLASKEKRIAQIKKLTTALFSEKQNKFIYETASLANTAFGGFLGGKLLDALIVGLVELVLFSIFGIPYAPMLATMMGIFNIIPFFGPIIGAIPAGFIVFISEPRKIILFIILTLIIQQIDGNIIEPKILGDRTGVSSLCVIVAISVMGNLWGVFGMIIGVPLFAVVIALVEQFADAKLLAKGLSNDLDDYYNDDIPEPQPTAAGEARLSKRYYFVWARHMLTPKKRRGEKPQRSDYMIYPTATETEGNAYGEWEDDALREREDAQSMREMEVLDGISQSTLSELDLADDTDDDEDCLTDLDELCVLDGAEDMDEDDLPYDNLLDGIDSPNPNQDRQQRS